MPAKSKAQFRLMQAAAHNPDVARKTGISQGTAREFVAGQSPKGLPATKGPQKGRRAKGRRRR